MDMTQTEIDELRRLHDAATPAPWNGTWDILTEDGDPVARTDVSLASDPAIADNDGPLIVAARNALPALLDAAEERDRLKAKLAALVGAIELLEPYPHNDESYICQSFSGKPCDCPSQLHRDAVAKALAAAKEPQP